MGMGGVDQNAPKIHIRDKNFASVRKSWKGGEAEPDTFGVKPEKPTLRPVDVRKGGAFKGDSGIIGDKVTLGSKPQPKYDLFKSAKGYVSKDGVSVKAGGIKGGIKFRMGIFTNILNLGPELIGMFTHGSNVKGQTKVAGIFEKNSSPISSVDLKNNPSKQLESAELAGATFKFLKGSDCDLVKSTGFLGLGQGKYDAAEIKNSGLAVNLPSGWDSPAQAGGKTLLDNYNTFIAAEGNAKTDGKKKDICNQYFANDANRKFFTVFTNTLVSAAKDEIKSFIQETKNLPKTLGDKLKEDTKGITADKAAAAMFGLPTKEEIDAAEAEKMGYKGNPPNMT